MKISVRLPGIFPTYIVKPLEGPCSHETYYESLSNMKEMGKGGGAANTLEYVRSGPMLDLLRFKVPFPNT